MRKIPGVYILYALQIFLIGIFILVLLAYNLQVTEKSFLENRMYSENVTGIQLSDHQFPEDVDLTMPKINADFMLYKYLTEGSDETVRGVYGTSDVFGLSDYITTGGRFFETEDYENKTHAAVVGQKILPITFEENGKRYYAYNQQMYEVIGVFQDTGSDLDHTVYLNLTRLLEEESNIGLYYVDAKDGKTVNAVLTEMKSNASDKYSTMDIAYESAVSYEMGRAFNTLLIFAVLAAVFCLLITTTFFVIRQKFTVAIQKLCGMTWKNLLCAYGKKMILVIATFFSLIVAAMLILSGNLNNSVFQIKTLAYHHYVITGMFLLVLGSAATCYIVKLADNIDISDTLKGL